MKRQIRSSVFETNSSSMHSLVIKKNGSTYSDDELRKNLYLDRDNMWDIWHDDYLHFGRAPFQCLATFDSKVRYAIASLCNWRDNREEVFQEIESVVMEIIPDCYGIKLPKMHYSWETEDHIYYGSVDEDILSSFLKNENISLKEFLTNKKYVVIVDGDEYCIWDSLKKSGLVDASEIEKECW